MRPLRGECLFCCHMFQPHQSGCCWPEKGANGLLSPQVSNTQLSRYGKVHNSRVLLLPAKPFCCRSEESTGSINSSYSTSSAPVVMCFSSTCTQTPLRIVRMYLWKWWKWMSSSLHTLSATPSCTVHLIPSLHWPSQTDTCSHEAAVQ